MKPGEGFALKVEPLNVTMSVRTISTLVWLGEGSEPRKRRAWWEWIRENVFRRAPRWREKTMDELSREMGWGP